MIADLLASAKVAGRGHVEMLRLDSPEGVIYSVEWLDGDRYDSKDHPNGVDARRQYNRKLRELNGNGGVA